VQLVDRAIQPEDPILVTGAGGFIGRRVVGNLLARGATKIVCLTRPSSAPLQPRDFGDEDSIAVRVIQGNLLSPDDCERVSADARVIYHLAAGRGEKSYPDAFSNSVVTTRNLLDACLRHQCLKRFVNVSSFAVYSNRDKPRRRLLDETCPVEPRPEHRGQAYCYAKVRQDELVAQYARDHGVPCVFVRPGVVYGPGNEPIHGRVGLGTFGIFLHLGGGNTLPLSYVDNCAEAIVLAGIVEGIDGEVFNVVDDDLPTSRQFLRAYKREAKRFRSVYLPHSVSYLACWLWERYAAWSEGQLPPVYGRGTWHATWKKTFYSNEKLKHRLGWRQPIPTSEGLRRYFAACREKQDHA
jgi:nucleoside-diphosphate-sugar epimerase